MADEQKMRTEKPSDVRKRAWQTRRTKYGPRGHAGPYGQLKPIHTQPWYARMRSMQEMLIKLYRQGLLSEGQVSKATGLDRVSCRDLAISQANSENERERKGWNDAIAACERIVDEHDGYLEAISALAKGE